MTSSHRPGRRCWRSPSSVGYEEGGKQIPPTHRRRLCCCPCSCLYEGSTDVCVGMLACVRGRRRAQRVEFLKACQPFCRFVLSFSLKKSVCRFFNDFSRNDRGHRRPAARALTACLIRILSSTQPNGCDDGNGPITRVVRSGEIEQRCISILAY